MNFCALRITGHRVETRLRHGSQYRAGPGSKILRRDLLTGDFLEILIHIGRGHVLATALFIHILQQFLAGQFLTGPRRRAQ